MKRESVLRISAIIHRDLVERTLQKLAQNGVQYVRLEAGRYPILKKRGRLVFDFYGNHPILDTPVSILEILVEPKSEDWIMNLIKESAELNLPGHGSIYSEEISLIHPIFSALVVKREIHSLKKTKAFGFSNLTGIFCILPRGSADSISRSLLQNGIGVPTISYGTGTGIRDRLGLLRITIPKEKEILKLCVHTSDAEYVLDFIIDIGKLDLPGRGFIFEYPIKRGLLNTKLSLEDTKQTASIDQIISALDLLHGNMEWRKKSNQFRSGARLRNYFNGVNVHLNCSEGTIETVLSVLRKAGVGSSTISKNKILELSSSARENEVEYTPARDSADLLIPKSSLPEVLNLLEEIKFYGNEFEGMVQTEDIPRAFSYQSRTLKKK
ncbi:hypothetical protein P3G55_03215 [Leptospira sp. 96542]|nr:hypothetical protein [Leptospira sp. 96542]